MTNERGQYRMHTSTARLKAVFVALLYFGLCCAAVSDACAQAASPSREQLEQQVASMQTKLQAEQQAVDAYHSELLELRAEVEKLKSQINPGASAATTAGSVTGSTADLEQAVTDLQERQSINQAEIQVHEQEKVESASKYPLKFHGLILFNASVNNGALDNATLPGISVPVTEGVTNGSVSATGSQTIFGLNASGPQLWGAHTYGNLEMGFSNVTSGGYSGNQSLFRLRTAAMQMAWPKTTVEAGISPLLLTPYYATSYFSIAQPAMSWSGALWGWLPQLSVTHSVDLSQSRHITVAAALADIPDAYSDATTTLGQTNAAERSRYPGVEFRSSYSWGSRLPQSIGVGGYWSPHSYGSSGSFDAWAGTLDWKLSLPEHLQLAGEYYNGVALGGLSAGTYKDTIALYQPQTGSAENANLTGLRDSGGWLQLKYQPVQRLELNAAFGEDNADSSQLRSTTLDLTNPYLGLARNQTTFVNVVFRPISTIVLSGEYRQIRSWQINGPANVANIFGFAAGYEF